MTRCFSVVLAGLLVLSSPLRAQQDSALLANGTSIGATVGILSAGGLATFSLEVLTLRAHAAGGAFSLAWVPDGWVECDVGAAYNVSLTGSTVFLKGGVGALVKTAYGGPYTHLGVHIGAAYLARTGGGLGMLLNLTGHIYPSGGAAFWTIGIGLASLPPTLH